MGQELLEQAIRFASKKHAGQVRKGTDTPYIVHPLEVMTILMRMKADTNLMIAGLLHDTVEDTDTTVGEIEELFGQDVADLVSHHSEDKSKSWQERKETAINELKTADLRLKMLIMADKLSNLRSIAADYSEIGDELWDRFNAPVEKQSWYYSSIQDALYDMQDNPNTRDAYWEMVGKYKDVFVRYFLSIERDKIYMISRHREDYVLVKNLPVWQKVDYIGDDVTGCLMNRLEAEATEDRWADTLLMKNLEEGYSS